MKKTRNGRSFKSIDEYEAHRDRPKSGDGSRSFGERMVERRTYDSEFDRAPFCAYCQNTESLTPIKGGRYHCNNCFRSTSPTVGTDRHKARVEHQKLDKLQEAYREGLGVRESADIAGVNKNTADRYFKIWDDRAEEQYEPKKEKTWAERLLGVPDEPNEVSQKEEVAQSVQPKREKTWAERVFGVPDEPELPRQEVKTPPPQPKQEKNWAERLFGVPDEPEPEESTSQQVIPVVQPREKTWAERWLGPQDD